MYKFVIVLTILVNYCNALTIVPLELSKRFSEIQPRKEPSTLTEYLLPKDSTKPTHYDVSITTDIDQGKFDFSGEVDIYLKAEANVDRIVIHQRPLTIELYELTRIENNIEADTIELESLSYNETTEFLTFPLVSGKTLVKDNVYKLHIKYKGELRGSKASENDAGFYRSSYINAEGVETWLATTQFESTDARHGFPCYDEPALKATFTIRLKHGSAYSAISNMPVKEEVPDGSYTITTFETTPIMSTYLIAFVVSDFAYVESTKAADKVTHRVYGRPDRNDQLDFTLEAGVKILDELDKYLGVNYFDNIPKMDQIGIPDFAAGAMENWGLVTYAESAFYLSATSPLNQKDRISKIVAHEFAHQWFGNLVSPEWWNYIWLNEGFATLFEYYIPNIVYSEYQALDYFTIQVCQRVLITDSVSDIRPMTFAAYSPSEISSLFDRIAYDKSGCVINMVMHAVGEEAFKAGLTRYLVDRRNKEANSEHLFSAIQTEAAALGTIPITTNVNAVFGIWSTQRGYPILKVSFNTIAKSIVLEQEAFLIDSLTDADNLLWTIPYNFITNEELNTVSNEDTAPQGWLTAKSQTLSSSTARDWTTANFVLFNKKMTGYYRVTYDTDNWNAIISFMANKDDAEKIHYLNRAQLLGDAMNIARANRLSYDIPLRLARNMMKHETSYFTWTPFINDLNYLEQITFETTSYSKILKFAVDVGTAAYNHYSISETTLSEYYDIITRYNLVNFMCRVGYNKCHEDTNAALINYLDDKLTISSYLKPAILQNGLRNANSEVFLKVWKRIMESTTQADRSTFISGLGLTKSEENIQYILGSVLTEDGKKYDDVTINYKSSERNTILTTIASSTLGGFRRIFELLKTEEVTVKKIFGNNIVTVFSTLASRTSNEETLTELEELMKLYEANDIDNRFNGYITTAKQNIAWILAAGDNFKLTLDTFYPDTPEEPGKTNYILPQDTRPIHYDVTITTDIDQGEFNFTGTVVIYLKAETATDRIVIHHRQLTIDSIKLLGVKYINEQYIEFGYSWPLKPFIYNSTNEFLTIPLNNLTLTVDNFYKLEINYQGVLRGTKAGQKQSDAGFYRSSYTTSSGVETWLAATQFESTDARHGFPCYDEPALKATFTISLKHGSAYSAISNMPVKGEVADGSYTITTFETTPIMSTYLIAFVVSDFEFVESTKAADKVTHRVYGRPDRVDQLDFTLEAGVKILDELDKYLGVNYSANIPKMDQIAIPDFAAGAMENWGLVTYAESAFYYSATSPHNQKDRISKIVAHEFAHQWFGNLVSPEWWNYIWLNEGFATLFEYYIPNIVYSEYQALDYFTIQVCQRVLITDSRSNIRPMTSAAFSPSEISRLFDSIAYDKSGCVINMVMHAVGEKAFKAGLTRYLGERGLKEANSEHLFTAIQTEAAALGTIPVDTNVNSFFGKWSTQRGYPILKVSFNTTTKSIVLEQEAFLIDSLTDADNLLWTIPYNFITDEELNTVSNEDTAPQGWLTAKSQTLSSSTARNWTTANFVLFNKKMTGYYRVTYDTDNWNAIISFMANRDDAEKIHYLNRAQLLGDAMNIARAKRLSYDIPLRLARNMMKHETSYFTWTPFINDFNYLEPINFETTSNSKILKLAVDVGTAAYNHYSISETILFEYYDIITRYNLVNFMCRVGYNKCHEDTNAALINYLDDKLTISSYLKPAILQNGLRNANSEVFLKVWKRIMESTTQADRSTFISGLGLTKSEENIQYILGSVLIEDGKKYDDVTINYKSSERNTILTTIASSTLGGFRRIFELLKTEEVTVKKIFGNNIVTVFSTLASRTSTEETLTQLEELMKLYEANDIDKRFNGYITTAKQNIAWILAEGANFKLTLDTFYPDTPEEPGKTNYILPQDTRPIHYDVTITTDIDQGEFNFTGTVAIYLKAETATDRIVIHHRQLTIGSIKLLGVKYINEQYIEFGYSWPLKPFIYNSTNEFLTIPLNNLTLTVDNFYKLEINYQGVLRGTKAGEKQSDAGFYRSSYTTSSGVETWLAATQFESTDARHGFPCYDEPALKATFTISLKHGSAYSAISNMPVKGEVADGSYTITTFETTPIMSTYLIAFVVSDFAYVESTKAADKVTHRVYGRPDRDDQLDFTLEAGIKILDELDKYLGVNYSANIPKMDQIAIPDFAAGAMENWGLVTYAESQFYLSPTSPHNQKDRISKIVAHEFAHQWFGNLVSPEWWNFIWLNEGFATLFQYYIPNIVYSEYQALDYFTIQVCQRVLITDSRSNIRPMTSAAYSPGEISRLFDSIAYDKSGCVINMVLHAVGEEAFKAGLTRYLGERGLKEANSEHLFTAIQTEAAALGTIPIVTNVNSFFGKWSTQRGYPILKVSFNTTTKSIVLEQEAFLIDSLTDADNLLWTIPYNFITDEELNTVSNEDTAPQGWLTAKSQTLSSSTARNWTTANFVLFNKKMTGYYRVTYDTDNWNAIISFMANKDDAEKIHYLNRAQLLGDAMNIARANRLNYDIPLRLAQNMMKHETSYFTWTPFINDFNYLEQITFETTSYSKILKFAVDVGTAAYNHYSISETTLSEYYDIITRYNLVNFMCRVGYNKCHEDTNAALINYLDDKLTVSSYLKPAILQNGLRNANSEVFLKVWKRIMESTTQADRSTFISGLGFTKSEENIKLLVESVLTENSKEYNDVTINYSDSERNTILTTIASSTLAGFKRILELLKTEEVAVKKIFGDNIVTVLSTLASRTSNDATVELLEELLTLYAPNDKNNNFPGYNTTIHQNSAWNLAAGATIKAPLDSIIEDESDSDGANSFVFSTVLVTFALLITQIMA